MWNHAATQSNVGILRKRGVRMWSRQRQSGVADDRRGAAAEIETIVAAVMELAPRSIWRRNRVW